MIVKPKIYLYEFSLYVPRGEISLRFPCTFFLTWSQAKNSSTTIAIPTTLTDNIVPFNALMSITCEMIYDCGCHRFVQKLSNLFVYLTSVTRPNEQPKLAGYLKLDLSKSLNSSDYDSEKKYSLQKCPDKNSSLTLSLRGKKIREITEEDSLQVKEGRLSRKNSVTSIYSDTSVTKEQNIQIDTEEFKALEQDYAKQNSASGKRYNETKQDLQSPSDSQQKDQKMAEIHEFIKEETNIQINELRLKCNALEVELKGQIQKGKNLQQQIIQSIDELQKCKVQKDELNQEQNHFKQENQLLKKHLKNLQSQFILLIAQKDKRIAEQQNQLDNKEKAAQYSDISIHKTIAKISELQEKLANQQLVEPQHIQLHQFLQQIADLRYQLDEACHQIRELTERNIALEIYQKRIKQLDTQRNENFHSIQMIESIMNEKTIVVQQLQVSLQKERSKNVELETQLSNKEYELQKQQKIIDKLKEQFEKIVEAYNKLKDDLKYYQQKQEIMNQNFEILQKSSGNLIKELKEKDTSASELHYQMQELENRLSKAIKEGDDLKVKLQEKSQETNSLQQSFKDIKEQNCSLQLQIENLTREVSSLQQSLMRQSQKIAQKQLKFRKSQQNCIELHKQLEDTSTYIHRLQQQNVKLKTKFEGISTIILQINEQLQISKMQANKLRAQVQMKDIAFQELSNNLAHLLADERFGSSSRHSKSRRDLAQKDSEFSPSMNCVDKQTIEKLTKQVAAYKDQIMRLHEQIFAQSSIKHEVQLKFEELEEKYSNSQKKLQSCEKKMEQTRSIHQEFKKGQNGINVRSLISEIKSLRKENDSYIKLIESLRQSEMLNLNELEMIKQQNQYFLKFYRQNTEKSRLKLQKKEVMELDRSPSKIPKQLPKVIDLFRKQLD